MMMETDVDAERRTELRSFLREMRARLQPRDVGLPERSRRRVPGLRRQEVAELIGTSDDWYRWFESGRPITVSPRFISRLCEVLRLSAGDRVTLHLLALPDLYRALVCSAGSDGRRALLAAS